MMWITQSLAANLRIVRLLAGATSVTIAGEAATAALRVYAVGIAS